MHLWVVAITGLVATLFWSSELLLPVKLLVVLVHECWHGAVALLAGARLEHVEIDLSESGEALVSNLLHVHGFVATVSAGYLGSALTGAVLLNRGLSASHERVTLSFFAVLLFYMCYLFAPPGGVAFLTGLGWSLVLLMACYRRDVAQLALLITGTLFCWYCVYDLLDFTRDLASTDAGIFARYLTQGESALLGDFSPWWLATLISGLWASIVIGILIAAVVPALKEHSVPPQETIVANEAEQGFPGEVTPEVESWLMENGFGLDGRPLPPEMLDGASGTQTSQPDRASL